MTTGTISTIGDQSRKTLTDLTQLILLASAPKEMETLLNMQTLLAEQAQVLIDKVLVETANEYKAALRALKKANDFAEEAKSDLDKISQYIKSVGRALDVLAKLIATL